MAIQPKKSQKQDSALNQEKIEKKLEENNNIASNIPEKTFEKTEYKKAEEILTAELRREIDVMETDPDLKKASELEKEKIGFLGEKEKLEHLLKMARTKGLIFTINVARKMNDPFILDLLHDTLAREGYFKDFLNKSQTDDDQAVQTTGNVTGKK